VLDWAVYSAFESTWNCSIVSYRVGYFGGFTSNQLTVNGEQNSSLRKINTSHKTKSKHCKKKHRNKIYPGSVASDDTRPPNETAFSHNAPEPIPAAKRGELQRGRGVVCYLSTLISTIVSYRMLLCETVSKVPVWWQLIDCIVIICGAKTLYNLVFD